ncbi:OmpH family outer membrane protein [Deltaproteobacteria bacterium]|nr:OmpH family outer membrane protein [Deltaproteobacteria bacterium]
MKKIIIALVVFMMMAAPVLAETKIGYVDLQKAISLSKAGVKARAEIAEQFKKYQEEFNAKREALEKTKVELEKQAVLLSDSAKAQKERSFQQDIKDLQRFEKDAKEELQQKDSDQTQLVLRGMLEVLEKLGADGGYQLILEKTQSGIFYADQSIDLTDELIKAFDAAN